MKSRVILARAKLNLTLEVLGRRRDGYHEICTVMVRLALADRLEFAPSDELRVTATGRTPSGQANLVHQAADALRRESGVWMGTTVRIEKRIPVAAGLGGGSADAAAAMLALNDLWGLNWSLNELIKLGATLGADIPFCLLGQPALAEGKGERLTPLPPVPQIPVVVVTPRIAWNGPKTASVYSNYRPDVIAVRPNHQAMLEAIRKNKPRSVATLAINTLEASAIELHPVIATLKHALLAAGAGGAIMAGSGPSVIALCPGGQNVGRVAAIARRFPASVFITALAGNEGN